MQLSLFVVTLLLCLNSFICSADDACVSVELRNITFENTKDQNNSQLIKSPNDSVFITCSQMITSVNEKEKFEKITTELTLKTEKLQLLKQEIDLLRTKTETLENQLAEIATLRQKTKDLENRNQEVESLQQRTENLERLIGDIHANTHAIGELKKATYLARRQRELSGKAHSHYSMLRSQMTDEERISIDEALFDAAWHQDIGKATIAIAMGAANNDFRNAKNETSLHQAVWTRNIEMTNLILEIPSTDIDCVDEFDDTPLWFAAYYGCFGCVKTLVERGAALNVRSTWGSNETAMGIAEERNFPGIASYLASVGAMK